MVKYFGYISIDFCMKNSILLSVKTFGRGTISTLPTGFSLYPCKINCLKIYN